MYKAILLSLYLLTSAAFAQRKAPVFDSVPPIEDQALYNAFFNYHQNLITAQQAAKVANPQASGQLDQQMASLLQVGVGELPIVVANTQRIIQTHASLNAQLKNLASAPPAKGQPTPTQLNAQFQLQHVRATVEGVLYLYQHLSPGSWKGLHDYIVGPYKTNIYKH